jgi:prefoldin subunit 5
MLRAEAEQVRRAATAIAEKAIQGQISPLIKQIDELTSRIAALEKAAKPVDKPKGKTDGKL